MLLWGPPEKSGCDLSDPRGRTDWDPPSQTEDIALCISTLGVGDVDDERGVAPRMLLLGGGKGAEDARGIARADGVADGGADEEGGRGGNLDGGATERPRPKTPDDAAGPARCHPQGADIVGLAGEAKTKSEGRHSNFVF